MRMFCWMVVYLLVTANAYGQNQESSVGMPAGSVQSYISNTGDIVYYTTGLPVTPEDDFKRGFEEAVKASDDMKRFIEKYPEAYLAAGKGGVFYGMTEDEIKDATFDATVFASGVQYRPTGVMEKAQDFITVKPQCTAWELS